MSQVPVPALPSVLVAARSRGINTQPIADWAERRGISLVPALPRPKGDRNSIAGRRQIAAQYRAQIAADISTEADRRARAYELARRYGVAAR